MNCLLVLSLAVLGASAAPCSLNLNSGSALIGQALPGRNVFSQTQVIENPTSVIPSCLPQTSVSQSCHCLKTIVRPQIRNEVITVPQVDRIVRVVPSPVVEAVSVNLGGNTRNAQLPTFTSGLTSGFTSGLTSGFTSGLTSGLVSGISGGLVESGIIGGSYPRIVEGFGGVINSGIVGTSGCGCGSNIIV